MPAWAELGSAQAQLVLHYSYLVWVDEGWVGGFHEITLSNLNPSCTMLELGLGFDNKPDVYIV